MLNEVNYLMAVKKNLKLLILILLISNNITAQKTYIYYLDKDFIPTTKDKVVLYGEGRKVNDNFELNCYDINKTKLLLVANFTDSSIKHLNGEYTSFFINGNVEQTGIVKQDKKDGLWQKWDSTGNKIDSIIYEKGKALVTANFSFDNFNKRKFYSTKDSLNNTLNKESYDSLGNVDYKINFKGDVGIIWNKNDDGKINLDTVYTREEIESEFPGGIKGWSSYLQKKLNAQVPVDKKAPKGYYTVVVRFTIEKDGSITDIIPETNVGYGCENEVVRLIKKGPKWKPANQYGRIVKSVKRQPVTFVVSE